MVFWRNSNTNKAVDVNEAPPPGYVSPRVDSTALVTGSSGLCGSRLVEMLLERGTKTVIAFDIVQPDAVLTERFEKVQKDTGGKIVVVDNGDLCSDSVVEDVFQAHKIDIVYHIAALVGPFHEYEMYHKVNVEGTQRIIQNCKKYKVRKLVYSSSPSTRFTGADIEGLREDQLEFPLPKYVAQYAETKAIGEILVHEACDNESLFTISVAPHQIYGPYDRLFLQKFLEVSGSGKLRIFGHGQWKISICYNDNYCHGLMCGADALYKVSPALAKFYIITDEHPQVFWNILNQAGIAMGFTDLHTKFHLPIWLLYVVATFANVVGWILNKKFKLNYFTVRMSTMHRYFDISNAKRDLKYQPIISFEEAWPITLQYFQEQWLPQFLQEQSKNKKQKHANIESQKNE
jgi:nucleoside-diphosphate-sugar epimerase